MLKRSFTLSTVLLNHFVGTLNTTNLAFPDTPPEPSRKHSIPARVQHTAYIFI